MDDKFDNLGFQEASGRQGVFQAAVIFRPSMIAAIFYVSQFPQREDKRLSEVLDDQDHNALDALSRRLEFTALK